MGRKKARLPRGTVVRYECEDNVPKTEVSAVFSASTGILTVSYSQAEASTRQPPPRDARQPPLVNSSTNEATSPAENPTKTRKQVRIYIVDLPIY